MQVPWAHGSLAHGSLTRISTLTLGSSQKREPGLPGQGWAQQTPPGPHRAGQGERVVQTVPEPRPRGRGWVKSGGPVSCAAQASQRRPRLPKAERHSCGRRCACTSVVGARPSPAVASRGPPPKAFLQQASLPPRALGSSSTPEKGPWASVASSVGPSAPQRLWLANQEKKGRGRGRGAWWTRTVRGERQALMVASSLAVSRSSCSWGLKTTELTTSW